MCAAVWQDWRYFHDNRADHDLPLEPGTRIQLGLGQAMTSVELIAASKLRGWIFKYLSDLFANEVACACVCGRSEWYERLALTPPCLVGGGGCRWMWWRRQPWAC